MDIYLDKISKRYGSRWIFRDVSYEFISGQAYALTGSNGAGKSTLLNILVGKIPYTKGQIEYSHNGNKVRHDEVYQKFSIATTAMSLIEEYTLEELMKFHFRFREPIENFSLSEMIQLMYLERERKKFIGDFSSGMKQRVKLALALYSSSEAIILDEPGANLDQSAKAWFQEMLLKFRKKRTLIIASNEEEDYRVASEYLNISEYSD